MFLFAVAGYDPCQPAPESSAMRPGVWIGQMIRGNGNHTGIIIFSGEFIVNQMKGEDMNYHPFIVLLVATIILAGCVSESKEKGTPIITPTVTTPAIPTTPAQKIVEITKVVTTKKTVVTTKTSAPTVAPSKPIESPVTLNGTSGNIMRFHTIAPGLVKFTIRYSSSLGDNKECSDYPRAVIRLAGASIDTALYNGVSTASYTGTTTFNLVSPGKYSLTTSGCYGWKVDIDNA
jgi:hypothetical protein